MSSSNPSALRSIMAEFFAGSRNPIIVSENVLSQMSYNSQSCDRSVAQAYLTAMGQYPDNTKSVILDQYLQGLNQMGCIRP